MSRLSKWTLQLQQYAAAAKRLHRRRHRHDFSGVRRRFYDAYWRRAAEHAGCEIAGFDGSLVSVCRGERCTLVQFHFVNIDTYFSQRVMAQKPLVARLLGELGLRTPRYLEYDLLDVDRAWRFCEESGAPCVVKPADGSGGVGVTTGIETKEALQRASVAAAAKFRRPRLVVEEQIAGDSYRLLYLDGELIDALQRRRPTVQPDGRSTIAELIRAENLERLEADPIRSLNQLTLDLDCRLYLSSVGLKPTSVPSGPDRLTVKNASNENSSRDNSTVLEGIHPSYASLGRRLTDLLGGKLIGVDLMTTDIGAPLDEAGGAIGEVNIPPGLHYHELVDNPERRPNVGAAILDFILQSEFLSTPRQARSGNGTERSARAG